MWMLDVVTMGVGVVVGVGILPDSADWCDTRDWQDDTAEVLWQAER